MLSKIIPRWSITKYVLQNEIRWSDAQIGATLKKDKGVYC